MKTYAFILSREINDDRKSDYAGCICVGASIECKWQIVSLQFWEIFLLVCQTHNSSKKKAFKIADLQGQSCRICGILPKVYEEHQQSNMHWDAIQMAI